MSRAFRTTWRHSKPLSIRFTMKIMMWWWQITISSVCWKYPSFSRLTCGTKPGCWDKLSYFLKEWKSTGNLHHICKKHVVYCYTFQGVVTDSFAVYVFSGGGNDLGGGFTYLQSNLYITALCIAGHPVYYGHRRTSQNFQLPYIFCKVDLYIAVTLYITVTLPFPKGGRSPERCRRLRSLNSTCDSLLQESFE